MGSTSPPWHDVSEMRIMFLLRLSPKGAKNPLCDAIYQQF